MNVHIFQVCRFVNLVMCTCVCGYVRVERVYNGRMRHVYMSVWVCICGEGIQWTYVSYIRECVGMYVWRGYTMDVRVMYT